MPSRLLTNSGGTRIVPICQTAHPCGQTPNTPICATTATDPGSEPTGAYRRKCAPRRAGGRSRTVSPECPLLAHNRSCPQPASVRELDCGEGVAHSLACVQEE